MDRRVAAACLARKGEWYFVVAFPAFGSATVPNVPVLHYSIKYYSIEPSGTRYGGEVLRRTGRSAGPTRAGRRRADVLANESPSTVVVQEDR